MFRLKTDATATPPKYPTVDRHIGTVKEKMWVEVDGKKLRKGVDYITQTGLQEYMVTREDVNILLLGSQPGSGKTAGLLLAALDGIDKKGHGVLFVKKQLISTKEGAGTIIEDAKLFYKFADAEFTSSENPTFKFPKWGTSITFTHANFPNTPKGRHDFQEKFKNFQTARIFMDEATDHPYHVFVYLQSRNRDTSGVLPRMILTFNVNSSHWTRQIVDWWLMKDPETGRRIPDPAKIGRVRYALIRGETPADIVWGDTKQEVIEKAHIVVPKELAAIGMTAEDMVKSIAFRPANMAENMEMMTATQGRHAANVFNLGDVETRKLFYEDWDADDEGDSDIGHEVIDSIFTNPQDPPDAEMYASADISGGGDACVMYIWRGNTIVAREEYLLADYRQMPAWVTAKLTQYGVSVKHFAFDATGLGQYLKDFIRGEAIVCNTRPRQEYDEAGNPVTLEEWFNLRSQLMGKMQYMLQTGAISCAIPPDKMFPHGPKRIPKAFRDILREESEVFRRKFKGNKLYYRSKDEFKDKFRYSPNEIDAITYKAVFHLDAKQRKEAPKHYSKQDYYRQMNRPRTQFPARRRRY